MKICFSSLLYNKNYESMLKDMINSCKKFHSDIPFIIYDKKMTDKILNNNSQATLGMIAAYIGEELNKKYDLVVHLDADMIITSELTELLKGDFDVACVRNNNDFGKAGFCDPGFTRYNVLINKKIEMQEYVNTGCHAVTNPQFWKDWQKASIAYANTCLLVEQDTMNDIFHCGKYKSVILDTQDKPYYYGVANTWGEKSHYESWKEIKLKRNKLYLDDKEVKILHAAGGEKLDGAKFDFNNMFTKKVRKYIMKLIKD